MGRKSRPCGRSFGKSRAQRKKEAEAPHHEEPAAPPEKGGPENHAAPAAQAQKETKIEREVIGHE